MEHGFAKGEQHNAVSVAGVLLLSEATLTEIPEAKAERALPEHE
jgi:hypothetical protein